MKTKGQREQLLGGSEFRWPVFLGLTMAWRSPVTRIPAEGSIPSSSTVLIPPASGCSRSRGLSSGMSQGQGSETRCHFGSCARRKQGLNDVPQLPNGMQTIRENETRSSTFPLPHMRQDLQRISAASIRRYARSAGSCIALLAIDRGRQFHSQYRADHWRAS